MVARGADHRTRQRIIDAATRQFAERGFKYVTVRAICREARANIAAVNYHFGDKMGLYREVLEAATAVVRDLTEAAIRAGEGGSAEDKLRAYVTVHCERIFAANDTTCLQQLIHREMHDPTEMLAALVDRALRPRFEYLGQVVAALLGLEADDERVVRCAVSIHAQIITFRPNPIVDRIPAKMRRAFKLERVSDHITAFSLAGLRAFRDRSGA